MAANIKANTDDNDIEVVDTAKIAKILSEMKGIDEAIKKRGYLYSFENM